MVSLKSCTDLSTFLSINSWKNLILTHFVLRSIYMSFCIPHGWSATARTATHCIAQMSDTRNLWFLTLMQCSALQYKLLQLPRSVRHYVKKYWRGSRLTLSLKRFHLSFSLWVQLRLYAGFWLAVLWTKLQKKILIGKCF